MPLRATTQHETFMAQPAGSYLVGNHWLYWCAHPKLFGFVLWGRPSETDIAALIRALHVELADDCVPHVSLVDVSRLAGVEPRAFDSLSRYVKDNHSLLGERVQRLGLVRPSGLAGAVVAGFYGVLDSPPYPVKIFEDPASALDWLDHASDVGVLKEIDNACSEITGVSPLVASLRAAVAEELNEATIQSAARALHTSERTLQRRLKQAGTTFQAELTTVKIGRAKQLLLDTDSPLTSVALDSGFASLQHFGRVFRDATGEAPGAWRAAAKK